MDPLSFWISSDKRKSSICKGLINNTFPFLLLHQFVYQSSSKAHPFPQPSHLTALSNQNSYPHVFPIPTQETFQDRPVVDRSANIFSVCPLLQKLFLDTSQQIFSLPLLTKIQSHFIPKPITAMANGCLKVYIHSISESYSIVLSKMPASFSSR